MQTPNPSSSPSTPGWRFVRRLVIGIAVFVTLIAAFYAEEDGLGRLAWKSYQSEAARKGIELNYATFIPPRVPDDQNFAMTPFLAPLFDFNPQPLTPGQSGWKDEAGRKRAQDFARDFALALDSVKKRPNEPVPLFTDLIDIARALQKKSKAPSGVIINTRTEAAAELLRDLEEYQPVLDELREASQRPSARFNVSYNDEDPTGILLPHLTVLRRVALVLSYRASSELALGRKDAALADLNLIISLADSLHNEPILIDQLVRTAILAEARQITWEGLASRAWNDQQLHGVQERFEKLTVLKDGENALHWQQAIHGTRLFDFIRTHPNWFANMSSAENTDSLLDVYANLMHFGPSGWLYLEQVSYNRIFASQVEGVFEHSKMQIHPSVVASNQYVLDGLAKSSRAAHIVKHRFLSTLLMPTLKGTYLKVAFSQTAMNECAVACALERFRLANGQFPESLAALSPQFMATIPNDVISGEPLKYRPIGESQFILYSVGWNEKDDNGAIATWQNSTTPNINEGDWVWQPYPGK